LTIDFTQQSAENCLCLDLDIRFGSVDLCECLQPENTNVQPKSPNETHQMVFNRVSIKCGSKTLAFSDSDVELQPVQHNKFSKDKERKRYIYSGITRILMVIGFRPLERLIPPKR
jgi:hypothetical protein